MTVEGTSQPVVHEPRPDVTPQQFRGMGRAVRGFEKRAMKGFGKRLREARDRVGLTADDVAEILGVKRNAVATWEKGTFGPRYVSDERFKPLAKRLRVSVQWLLYGVKDAEDGAPDPKLEQAKVLMREFGRRYPSLSRAIEILDKASATDSEASHVKDDLVVVRRLYRDFEDLFDA